jgi:hypothetical protein
MTLEQAIAACGYVCVECGSSVIRLDSAPLLGQIPVIVHYELPDGSWCPALSGGVAAELASMDLLAALAAVMVPLASYGEPVWHRRPRLEAA